MQQAVSSKIEEIAQRVADSEGLELVEVEVKGGGNSRFVRISIDKPEGVTHADCESVSLQVGTILDVEDVVPGGRYTLEVSSPGVERKLAKPQDYQRFQGKKVKISLRDALVVLTCDPLDGGDGGAGDLALDLREEALRHAGPFGELAERRVPRAAQRADPRPELELRGGHGGRRPSVVAAPRRNVRRTPRRPEV